MLSTLATVTTEVSVVHRTRPESLLVQSNIETNVPELHTARVRASSDFATTKHRLRKPDMKSTEDQKACR